MASESTRITRVRERNPNWTIDEIKARITNQASDDDRKKKKHQFSFGMMPLCRIYTTK
jgi:dephospho-CoA kinase